MVEGQGQARGTVRSPGAVLTKDGMAARVFWKEGSGSPREVGERG